MMMGVNVAASNPLKNSDGSPRQKTKREFRKTWSADMSDADVKSKLSDLKYKVFREGKYLDLEEELFLGQLMKDARVAAEPTASQSKRAKTAKELLAWANHKLVIKWANKFYKQHPNGTTPEDCRAAGNMGISRALTDYDPAMGYKFSTYASRWIMHFLERLSYKISKPATVPSSKIYGVHNVEKALDALRAENKPVTREIMDRLLADNRLEMIDYIKTKQFNKSCKSMDDPFTGCDGETTNLTDLLNPRIVESSTIGSWSMGTLDSEIKKLDCRRALQEAIDSLPDVQRTMINELFVKPQPMGKNGELKRTQAEVRRTMGITKGEGDKQYARAVAALREKLESAGYHGVADFYDDPIY